MNNYHHSQTILLLSRRTGIITGSYQYRQSPVPGTRKQKAGQWPYKIRLPRHGFWRIQEKRLNCRPGPIPETFALYWDEGMKTAHTGHTCWKKHRRHQWRSS